MKKLFSTKTSDTSFTIATLVLRVGLGLVMLLDHGLPKLQNFSELQHKFGDPLGLGPTVSLSLILFAEFFCSVFLILGLFTRLACIPLIIGMAVAFVKVHKLVYESGPGSGQLALVFLIGFTALLFTGPGKFSVDRLLGK